MTLSQFLSDIYDSLRVSEAHAEAAAGSADTMMESQIQSESERKQVKEDADTSGKDDSDKEEDTPAEEEEEEEEEPEDPLPAIEEECQKSKECAPFKHHYDECAARVQAAAEADDGEKHKGPKEDCVEEYFHLMHCTGKCAAPKLFRALK